MTEDQAYWRGYNDSEEGRGLSFSGPANLVHEYMEGAKAAKDPGAWLDAPPGLEPNLDDLAATLKEVKEEE